MGYSIIKSFLRGFQTKFRKPGKPGWLTLAILGLMVAYYSPIQAQTGPVDSFDTNHPVLTLTYAGTAPLGPIASSSSGSGILGGERDIEIELLNGATDNTQMRSFVASSVYVLECGSGISGNAQIQWDGPDNSSTLNPTGLGSVDLTDGGSDDIFRLIIISNDEDVTLTFTVYTDGSNYSTYDLFLADNLTRREIIIPFSNFSVAGGVGANFRNVGAVTLTIPPVSDLDMRLDLWGIASTNPPSERDDDDDDEDAPPPASPSSSGGGGITPTPTPSFPTQLPETGSLEPDLWLSDRWSLLTVSLIIGATVGIAWLRFNRRRR